MPVWTTTYRSTSLDATERTTFAYTIWCYFPKLYRRIQSGGTTKNIGVRKNQNSSTFTTGMDKSVGQSSRNVMGTISGTVHWNRYHLKTVMLFHVLRVLVLEPSFTNCTKWIMDLALLLYHVPSLFLNAFWTSEIKCVVGIPWNLFSFRFIIGAMGSHILTHRL